LGGGKAEGNKDMKKSARRQGCQLAEMTNIGVPVSARLHHHDRWCTEFYANGRKLPKGLEDEVGR